MYLNPLEKGRIQIAICAIMALCRWSLLDEVVLHVSATCMMYSPPFERADTYNGNTIDFPLLDTSAVLGA